MKNIISDKIGLSGRLVGIGKIMKDGSKEFHWLEKPISNMMLSKGVDKIFLLNYGETWDKQPALAIESMFWASPRRHFFLNNKTW